MERTTRDFTEELRLDALPALPQVEILGRIARRLWYVAATGRDQGTQRPTIHTLTPQAQAVMEMFGTHSLETLGAGRQLAATLGFEYPDALEQTVRASWKRYLEGQK